MKEITEKMFDVIKKKITKYVSDAIDHFLSEVKDMYIEYIDQYYDKYTPVKYQRHAMRGMPDLYSGITVFHSNGKFGVEFDGAGMMDDYQHDSPSFVLENVMEGFRGVPPYWIRTWSGSYNGEYFGYSGTMSRAFDLLWKNMEDIVSDEIVHMIVKGGL